MQPIIRNAHLGDLPYLYDICLKTGFSGKDASGLFLDKNLIGQYFAAPYLHYAADTCFIAEYENKPMGYIIGATNSQHYNTWLNEQWLPPLRKMYPQSTETSSDLEKFLITIINEDASIEEFLNPYPSHLHIDLLPTLQGKGMGRKLIEALKNKLKENGSTGLHLGASADNTSAISFYKKLNFHVIQENEHVVYMGIKL